ncbi:exodeoxyribonuclease V subunit gamma [Alteromonas sp. ASW11-36]|uniref:RecBCD enzyme subunit RecC n=1 Tax=Alteromonas arenosi TaxID=3055817 RepID=A0ABT7SWC8_9ALTE|nr:exodeoxyribonuclease V subunit gamma [Alteromonas sp. ASW11-36]MDM7860480.1 exodeoxyribonuclease V subunit gamma [Alteromonas sp. ASW11-36]
MGFFLLGFARTLTYYARKSIFLLVLRLYPSNKLEHLAELLGAVMRSHQASSAVSNPLAPTTILVESLGMQHWLNMTLATQQGVAMNFTFPMPTRFMWNTAREVLGDNTVPQQSPYKREVLVWRIYALLSANECINHPDMAPVKQYLSQLVNRNGTVNQAEIFEFCRSIADVFEQYMLYRPDWLANWEQGKNRDTKLEGRAESIWQAHLWRQLHLQQPDHPASLHQRAVEALQRCDSHQLSVPEHVYVFALNTMAPQLVEFLNAVAQHREIHIFHLNPCVNYWGDILTHKQRARAEQLATWVDQEVNNPLLANLGQQGRDLFNLLQQQQTFEISAFDAPLPEAQQSIASENLLQHVQQAIFAGEENATEFICASPDESIVIAEGHNAIRELQGLHDFLLARFEQDPELKPQDVLVMCPAIENYSPYIASVFAQRGKGHHTPVIPFSIADRAPLDSVPEIAAFLSLLHLPDSRFQVSIIVEYLRLEVVREHFELSSDDLQLITQWLKSANVRWGLDSEHQQQVLAGHADQIIAGGANDSTGRYSWQWGLKRLLIGLAHVDQMTLVQDVATVPDVEGQQARALGQLCLIVERLQQHRALLTKSRTIAQWQSYLHELKLSVFGSLQQQTVVASKFDQAIAELIENTELAAFEGEVSLPIIRDALTHSFSMPDAVNQFMTGQVTFCSMLPMRSIPFKIIAMLGMNDGEFPRLSSNFSIDLMQYTPRRIGDRSRRGDDRYLFLEAIISARSALYISYQAKSITDNSERQPSIVLREFCEYLNTHFAAPNRATGETTYVLKHLPLHPFSARHFTSGSDVHSYNQGWLRLAKMVQGNRNGEADDEGDVNDADIAVVIPKEFTSLQLANALDDPLKYYANMTLGMYLEDTSPLLEDSEPFTIDALTRYQVLQALVDIGLEKGTEEHIQDFLALQENAGMLPQDTVNQGLVSDFVEEGKRLIESVASEPLTLENVQADVSGIRCHCRVLAGTDNSGERPEQVLKFYRVSEFRTVHRIQHRIEQALSAVANNTTVSASGVQIVHKSGAAKLEEVNYPDMSPAEANTLLINTIDAVQDILRRPLLIHARIGEVVTKHFEPDLSINENYPLRQGLERLLEEQMYKPSLLSNPYVNYFKPEVDILNDINIGHIQELYAPLLNVDTNKRKGRNNG